MNNKVAAFGQRRAGVYLLSEIYNPDDTSSSVQNINKVIPAIGSLVVDDTVGEHNTLYVVYSVDAVTHKSTLVNAAFNESSNMIGDDANTMRMLFFSHAPTEYYYVVDVSGGRQPGVEYYIKSGSAFVLYTGDFVSGTTYYAKKMMTELHIDGRLSVYTSLANKYTIYHSATSTATAAQRISQYYLNGDGDMVEASMIPMERIMIPATNNEGDDIVTDAYRPVTCFTDLEMVDGDKYLVDVYDAAGGIISQFTLVGHDMSALVDINNAHRAITSMSVQCSQMSGNQFVIMANQTLDDLAFYLTIEYDRGDPIVIAIDNVNAYMHADISSLSVGGTIPILFKYYPSPSESLGITAGSTSYTIGATGRYISITKSLTMVESAASTKSKIAPIIYYRNNTFGLAPLVYFSDHTTTPAISTNYGTEAAVSGFTPSNITREQEVTLTYFKESISDNLSYVSKSTNTYTIKLNASTEASGVYYYFTDARGVYYGKAPRPKLIRTGQAADLTYKFSIASATGDYSAKDLFLKHYFYNANPPSPYGFTDALQPTHFRIRKLVYSSGVATGTAVISSEYSIDEFFSRIESNRVITTTENIYTNLAYPNTVIVEFLAANLNLSNSYDIIYGSPVDVTLS